MQCVAFCAGFNSIYHRCKYFFPISDITIELRSMGVPWTLHCWMNALAAAHELRLDTVIDQLLQDFLQVCPDDFSQQFVAECLPLLFSIFRCSKVSIHLEWTEWTSYVSYSIFNDSCMTTWFSSLSWTHIYTLGHFSEKATKRNYNNCAKPKKSSSPSSLLCVSSFMILFVMFTCFSIFPQSSSLLSFVLYSFYEKDIRSIVNEVRAEQGQKHITWLQISFPSPFPLHKTTKKKEAKKTGMMMIFPPKTTTDSSLSEL